MFVKLEITHLVWPPVSDPVATPQQRRSAMGHLTLPRPPFTTFAALRSSRRMARIIIEMLEAEFTITLAIASIAYLSFGIYVLLKM